MEWGWRWVSGSGRRGGSGGLPTCRGGPVCRDHVWDSAFALGASEAAVGFWPFCILSFIIALNVYGWGYFYSFFLFCYLRRHLSRSKCKHSGRGSQVVPAILTSIGAWELTCTSARTLCAFSSQFHLQWHPINSLKLPVVGMLIPQKFVSTTNWGFLFFFFRQYVVRHLPGHCWAHVLGTWGPSGLFWIPGRSCSISSSVQNS